jgi:drug/metabolite transporter (DMT)-like permease
MFEALRYTSALNAGTLYALVPGISAIFSAVLVREQLHLGKILAFVLGIFGSVWVVFRGDINTLLSLDYNKGDIIFIGGVFLMSLYTPLVKRFHSGEPVPVMTFWIILSGTVWLFFFNQSTVWKVSFEEIEFSVIAGLLYLSIFTTIISFFLLQFATIQIGPTKVASYSYLNPVAVLVVSTVFFGHSVPSLTVLPGVIIVLLAVIAIQKK